MLLQPAVSSDMKTFLFLSSSQQYEAVFN
uniref:Uncharacterized protein n=1 Tax=Anguilla anguilla TaxID=7936 RepID=A0A0E9PNS5_ANGAN